MTHRAEQILEAVRQRLTGLPTTGVRVERARVWPTEECPAISIERGDDVPTDTGRRLAFIDRRLQVLVTAYVKSPANFETDLHVIAAEVYAALFADHTQGLAFVLDTHWLGDSRPQTNAETETRSATMEMNFAITYRHQLTTTEA